MRAVIDGAAEVIASARVDGRTVLLDPEGFTLVRALGIAAPAQLFVRNLAELQRADLAAVTGDRVVVKLVSPRIPHRTDVGGVVVVPNEHAAVAAAIEHISARVGDTPVTGYTVNEFVPHDHTLGTQLLLGMRWTEDFGPVVTFGPGGVLTEFLAENLVPGREVAVLAPGLTRRDELPELLHAKAITRLATGDARGAETRISLTDLAALVQGCLAFAASPDAAEIAEFEINPLVLTGSGPVALDVLVRLREPSSEAAPERPIHKIEQLLEPRTVALIGVSEAANPGRVILQNLLRGGFPPERLSVVKPGSDAIDGVSCYPDIASLPGTVDLLILSIAASQTPPAIEQVIAHHKAESVIVIPGGLGERSGTQGLEQRMRQALAAARETPWQGPVVNGGNCLGVRSVAGRYNTLFIPEYKLPWPEGPVSPVAVISQSGAFAVAKSSKLAQLNPRYVISIGNQTDLTVGDYLTYLKDDTEVEVFACYVEGFRTLDGRRWLEAAAEITASGRTVLLYRGGRTPAGVQATASHTAAIAGDYAVLQELAQGAGVVLADTLADFEDLIRLFIYLRDKTVGGWRLGAVSNAGFECVAIADNLGRFRLEQFSPATVSRIEAVLQGPRLERVIEARNPVDLTPIMDDATSAKAMRAALDDENVDVGVLGCVPLTCALNTLPAGEGHAEDVTGADSIARHLAELRNDCTKAWVAVVDGGPQYDAMVAHLEAHGVPSFRTVDRALRVFETYCSSRLSLMDR